MLDSPFNKNDLHAHVIFVDDRWNDFNCLSFFDRINCSLFSFICFFFWFRSHGGIDHCPFSVLFHQPIIFPPFSFRWRARTHHKLYRLMFSLGCFLDHRPKCIDTGSTKYQQHQQTKPSVYIAHGSGTERNRIQATRPTHQSTSSYYWWFANTNPFTFFVFVFAVTFRKCCRWVNRLMYYYASVISRDNIKCTHAHTLWYEVCKSALWIVCSEFI